LEKESPIPIGYEAGWGPEPVWTGLRREEIPASSGKAMCKYMDEVDSENALLLYRISRAVL
jgi:hypothetical protein